MKACALVVSLENGEFASRASGTSEDLVRAAQDICQSGEFDGQAAAYVAVLSANRPFPVFRQFVRTDGPRVAVSARKVAKR